MKKTLVLVRHATAEDHSLRIKDFERKLIDKGLGEAETMGKWLSGSGIRPDSFITSPAPRASKTAEVMAAHVQYDRAGIGEVAGLYDGGPKAYLQVVNAMPEMTSSLILFGHNPDISFFAEYLAEGNVGTMKKCSVVILEFTEQKWEEISSKTGKFVSYTTPKQLREAH